MLSRFLAALLLAGVMLGSLTLFSPACVDAGQAHESGNASDMITSYNCNFSKSAWNSSEWLVIHNPISDHSGEWVQEADHIATKIPEGMTLAEAIKSREDELYVSMVLKKKVSGEVAISTVTSFEPEEAPLIVIADDIAEVKPGYYVYRKFIEVVIYKNGINIWQHHFENGKPSHERVAWSNFELKPNTKYELTVNVKGNNIEAAIDGHKIGYKSRDSHTSFYAGITACEGLNKFYNFRIEPLKPR